MPIDDTKTLTQEQRILQMTKRVLTDVARDTVTQPGLKHPLSQQTIEGIRDCLQLITSREAEILAEFGLSTNTKPHFVDEPQKNVVVSLNTLKSPKKKPD